MSGLGGGVAALHSATMSAGIRGITKLQGKRKSKNITSKLAARDILHFGSNGKKADIYVLNNNVKASFYIHQVRPVSDK